MREASVYSTIAREISPSSFNALPNTVCATAYCRFVSPLAAIALSQAVSLSVVNPWPVLQRS
jgi:hypothetical protein